MSQLIPYFVMMAVIAGLFVFIPVIRNRRVNQTSLDKHALNRSEMNTEIYRQRLAELEKDAASGEIEEEEFKLLKKELDLTLLNDIPDDDSNPRSESKSGGAVLIAMIVLLVGGSFTFYHLVIKKTETEKWMAKGPVMDQLVVRTLQRDDTVMEELRKHSIADFIRALQRKLQNEVDNHDGWFLLGNTYLQIKLPEPAQEAFQKAYRLNPLNVDYGIALARTQLGISGGRLNEDSDRVLSELYQRFPKHPGVLMTYGMAAFQSAQYEKAIQHWQALLEMGSKNPEDPMAKQGRDVLVKSIALARQRLAGVDAETTAAVNIPVSVKLDSALHGKIQGNETLFVLAKAVAGPPMPLAVKKLAVKEWPVEVMLSSKDAMMAQMSLTNFDEVQIIARISKSGRPVASAGDLQGIVAPVAITEGTLPQVTVTISDVVN